MPVTWLLILYVQGNGKDSPNDYAKPDCTPSGEGQYGFMEYPIMRDESQFSPGQDQGPVSQAEKQKLQSDREELQWKVANDSLPTGPCPLPVCNRQ